MARDFRHGPARRKGFQRQSQQAQSVSTDGGVQVPVWLWGVLLSLLLLAGFLVVKHFATQGPKNAAERSSEIYQSVEREADEAPITEMSVDVEEPEPSFNADFKPEVTESKIEQYYFYQELPHTEVVVDVEPLPIALPQPMWIQAGSFRDRAQAEREKTRLNQAGRNVDIAPVETRNGLIYRILSGPYNDRLTLNRERNHLRRMGADTRVIKRASP